MELRTTSQVAERLHITPKVLRRLVAEERLVPRFTAPGDRGPAYFDPADVERLAAELAQEAEDRAAALRSDEPEVKAG